MNVLVVQMELLVILAKFQVKTLLWDVNVQLYPTKIPIIIAKVKLFKKLI